MRLILLLFFLINVNFTIARQIDSKTSILSGDKVQNTREIKKKRSRAEIHYNNGNYAMALANLKEVGQLLPNDAEVHYKIGLCYYKLNDDSLSLNEFEKAYKLGEKELPEIHYYLAVTKQLNGFYEDALIHYQKEKAILKSDPEYLTEIDKHIIECMSGKELLKLRDSTIQLYTIGDSINTAYQESSIYLASDTLMYITSTKPSKKGLVSENIYYSKKRGKTWTNLSDLGKPVNTRKNDAVVGLADKGEKIFLYADVNGGDIYCSEKKGSIWTNPVVFGDSINSTHLESSLCFSADNSMVYFVSNRPGSTGGKDIFYSVKKESGWSKPLNIGSNINSEFDEESPFLLRDTLYFSSKGHNSAGGFDVFKTFRQNGNWVKPVNLGFPINSPYDELYYTILNDSKYLITDRPGGKGETDIYEIDLIENRREKKEIIDKVLVLKDSSASTNAFNNNGSADLVKFLGLKPILFRFGKFSLDTDSKNKLDAIIQYVIQNPDLKIEVRVYTDCRGSEDYNKRLSEKRALAIKEYIRKRDSAVIKQTKIVGMGEKNSLIDCQCDDHSKTNNNCSKEDHMRNRRAEFKLDVSPN